MTEKHVEVVAEITKTSIQQVLNEVKNTTEVSVTSYKKQFETINKQAINYIKATKAQQQKVEAWGNKFSKKTLANTLMLLLTALFICIGAYFTFEVISPVRDLKTATEGINTISKDTEAVTKQLNKSYKKATGESITTARFSYYWDKKDYLGAVMFWIGDQWKNILIIALIGSWIIYFIRSKKDRY